MTFKVGDKFLWNKRSSSILQVTEIGSKIKFSIDGLVPMSGSMCPIEFQARFAKKGKKLS